MSAREWAWTTAGAAAILSLMAGALAVWLLLTNPLPMVAAASHNDALGLVQTLAHAALEVAARLLRWA